MGTLFLDEIEDASPSFQAKFLRELDRGEFIRVGGQQVICPDVRLVAATNANLEDLVSEGRFRPDLYYRINEVTMNLPALRERREDIQLLANRLLVAVNRKNKRNILELSNDAMERLVSYHWPGNLRELQNVLARYGLRCKGSVLHSSHLSGLQEDNTPDESDLICTLTDLERIHIERVLKAVEWNRGRACRLLGIARPTLRRKTRMFNMDRVNLDFDLDEDSEGRDPSYA